MRLKATLSAARMWRGKIWRKLKVFRRICLRKAFKPETLNLTSCTHKNFLFINDKLVYCCLATDSNKKILQFQPAQSSCIIKVYLLHLHRRCHWSFIQRYSILNNNTGYPNKMRTSFRAAFEA